MAVDQRELGTELSGLDELDRHPPDTPRHAAWVWSATWPKLAATGIVVAAWQVLVWVHWRPEYALPGPGRVFGELRQSATDAGFYQAVAVTMQRALTGYGIAVVAGSVIGIAVSRSRTLRTAVGSLVTGLQTMPSIAWFPFAILLFKLSEAAILFVVVLGAAPSVANGLIGGVDHVQPVLVRAGRALGASGMALYRHVVLPAAFPAFWGGLKQGWAFAWRSLMAGELLVLIPGRSSIGARLTNARDLADAPALLAVMMVVLVIGILVDTGFSQVDRVIRRRWGFDAS